MYQEEQFRKFATVACTCACPTEYQWRREIEAMIQRIDSNTQRLYEMLRKELETPHEMLTEK